MTREMTDFDLEIADRLYDFMKGRSHCTTASEIARQIGTTEEVVEEHLTEFGNAMAAWLRPAWKHGAHWYLVDAKCYAARPMWPAGFCRLCGLPVRRGMAAELATDPRAKGDAAGFVCIVHKVCERPWKITAGQMARDLEIDAHTGAISDFLRKGN